MRTYIHEQADWPKFQWDAKALATQLEGVRYRQLSFLARIQALGFQLQKEAMLEAITEEVQKSSDIEGEHFDKQQVRSSIARRLGMEIGGLTPEDHDADGIIEVMLDATQQFDMPLTTERLFKWHADLFPDGGSVISPITVGKWREGPMQVVSGRMGHPKVHFEAPEANRLEKEMDTFLSWFNAAPVCDPVLKASLVHFWFVTIHPFDDGNGRIARAIADMALARSEQSSQRFYSMSAQIRKERNDYYDILESTQKGEMDVTCWMSWFLGCLDRAIAGTGNMLALILEKDRFWNRFKSVPMTARQQKVLNKILDGFEGKITTQKWAAMAKCSHDTALRDIQDLIAKGALREAEAGGRSKSYLLQTGI